MVDVSIVIVCMNNLNNLNPCLNSIKQHTHNVSYEVFVVAYLFSEENLKKVQEAFPWVSFIESKEIRGFSENNNLALKQAKGKYCFVLNDDTEMKMPVVDRLFETIESLPEDVAAVSPRSVYGDGKLQSCGRPKHTFFKTLLGIFKLWHEQKSKSRYVNQKGVFQTYDLWGAFFLIRTEIFKEVGWFDERYFFSPEDIALSRELNQRGYKCYVNADVTIVHYEGMTGKGASRLQIATKPASFKGNLIYYADGSGFRYGLVAFIFFCVLLPQFLFHWIRSKVGRNKSGHEILAKALVNSMKVCFTSDTPKEVFKKYYYALS